MSAIGAIFHRRGEPVERRALERMRGALKMYGPDREGLAVDGCMGVVWTHGIGFTPQDRFERQPIQAGGGAWLAFAGRLDHREELCGRLGLPASRALDITDGELVRLAWEAWGERTVDHLYGDYSFLAADPAHRRLVAVRGPLRGRPIHYFEDAGRLVVASMPKGIFALGDVPRELDDQRLADALVLNFEDREATYFKGIRALPLGHMLVAEPERLTVTRFYDLRDTPDLRLKRDEDYVEAAREALDAVVASAMRSVETPAISLSSGLDSTAVAVTALDLLERREDKGAKPLLGLVAVPEPGWDGRLRDANRVGDESGPVRALMARYPALDVRFIDSAGAPLDHELDKVMMAADMPIRGTVNLHWGIELDRAARADGRRVMLSGSGGNATLSMAAARPVLAGLFSTGRWPAMLRELRALNARNGERRWLGFSGLFGLAMVPHLPAGIFAAYARLRLSDTSRDWRRYSAIHPDFARDMKVEARMAEMGWDHYFQPGSSRRGQLARMLDRGNRHQAGVLATAYEAVTGVQSRDPLNDRKLAEFCYAIPDAQFYQGGVDRRLIRRMMASRLPDEILNAPRGRQAVDWHLRLKRDAARYEAELERLAEDPTLAGKVDIARLRAALHALPEQTPTTKNDHPDLLIAMVGLGRALAAARFVRSVEGRNR